MVEERAFKAGKWQQIGLGMSVGCTISFSRLKPFRSSVCPIADGPGP